MFINPLFCRLGVLYPFKMKKLVSGLLLAIFSQSLFAQEWIDMMSQPGKNFYDIQATFNDYWKDKDVNVPGTGYKPFKRWEHFMEPRVYPSGDLSLVSQNMANFEKFLLENSINKTISSNQNNSQLSASTTWTAVGPMGPMSGVATNGFPRKAGRDNFIAFHPTIPTTFWAGAPAGGLWKTTDGGLTWTTNTDYLSVIGCTDLAIDPSNPNTMYLATGDGYAGDTYCIGVLKSTDGGLTWNTTGLTFAVNIMREMRRLVINPNNPQILLAATNAGIYRTTNGGTSWTNVLAGNFYDIEFKPTDPNTVYVGGTTFRLSTDGGVTFTTISNGIPTAGCNRMAIAVTPADPNYVYVLRSSSSSSGFAGLYQSVSSGTAFTVMSTAPDVLANSCAGTGGGGQGWYDLCIAVSPTDKNKVNVGGVNVWSSNSGGATGTWTCIGCWIGTTAPAVYLKADHHDLEYSSTGTLYSATDGGIFSYNTSNWIDLNNQRNIAQIYKLGLSGLTANRWISGHQDNGTGLYTGTTYQASYAGDGMDCFIDRTNDMNLFASTPNGNFVRSTNGGASYSGATSGMSGTGGWVSPWKQDPVIATRLYAGRSQMFVSNNTGGGWAQAGTTGGSGTIVEFAIAPSNNQVIYVIQGNSTTLRKTTNGGTTWAPTAPVSGGAPTFVTIDPNDENTAWVTISGYSAGNKVFQTTNGGASWTNVSSNLPNLPANCSVYQPGTSDRIYVGMDVGVYYKDNSSVNWTLYNLGLPNAPISDMEISAAAPGLLRAATYGRGVYEVDLVQATASPVSSFTFNGSFCVGTPNSLLDNSSNTPTAWNWTITPNTGVVFNTTSTQNPTLSFSNPGTYSVSLVSGNNIGLSPVYSQTILVSTTPTLVLNVSSSVAICEGAALDVNASGALTYTWSNGGGNNPSTTYLPTSPWTYTVTGSNNGCIAKETIAVTIETCVGIKEIHSQNNFFSVYPNPANDKLSVVSSSQSEVTLFVSDVSGKIVKEQNASFKKDKSEVNIVISSLTRGVYFLKIVSKTGDTQTIKFVKD